MVSGIDLVAEQLRSRPGEPLRYRQDDVALDGHAVEVRITTEDPARGFVPHPGTVTAWEPPAGAGIRVDSHCEPGYVVTAVLRLAARQDHRARAATATPRSTAWSRRWTTCGSRASRPPASSAASRSTTPTSAPARVTTDWIAARGLPDYLEALR